MKRIFTLVLLLSSTSLSAQPGCDVFSLEKGLRGKVTGLNSNNISKDTSGEAVYMCRTRKVDNNSTPLLIIDGKITRLGKIGELNPHDIDSVTVLKQAAATALFGHVGLNGAIIVTTKSPTFIIKDKNTGQSLPGASVVLPGTTKGIAANEDGVADMNVFVQHTGQEFAVSYVGYQTTMVTLKRGTHLIDMERTKDNDPVVILACSFTRRISCGWGKHHTVVEKTQPELTRSGSPAFKVFPSPAQSGNLITAEIQTSAQGEGVLRLVSLDGKTIFKTNVQYVNGLNRFLVQLDSRWAKGIYFMQFAYGLHHEVEQRKILIQ